MNMPWGLIAIFFALTFFYYVSRKTKARSEDRRERLNESRQAYLDALLKKSKGENELHEREGEALAEKSDKPDQD